MAARHGNLCSPTDGIIGAVYDWEREKGKNHMGRADYGAKHKVLGAQFNFSLNVIPCMFLFFLRLVVGLFF